MTAKKRETDKRKGRGGARPGAGRPPNLDKLAGLGIGQACEVLWREASDRAVEDRRRSLPFAGKIEALWASAKAIPVAQRKDWLAGEGYEDHKLDLESWLHKRAGTPFDKSSAEFEGEAPQLVTLSRRPPKGTRPRIIAAVAKEFALPESTVDRLWKAYRRSELASQEP